MSQESNDKSQFLLGLFGGISVVSVIALIVLGVAFINMSRGTTTNNKNTELGANNNAPTDPNQPAQPTEPIDLKITQDDHIRGDFNAPITILEWSDFQCPYCQRFDGTIKQVVTQYGNKIRWVYRHFPLDSIHPAARGAAEASECASEQGKFWEFHDEVFASQSQLAQGATLYSQIAKKIGINVDQFDKCVTSRKYQSKVQAQASAGSAVGVSGTPGSFLNGTALGGALPYENLKPMIDNLLKS